MINIRELETVIKIKQRLKQLLPVTCMSILIFSCAQISSAAPKTTNDALNLAGTYHCHGHDSHDGDYKDATVVLTLDAKNSDSAHDRGAYHFALIEPDGTRYVGEAAASGNNLAIYFENTGSSMQTDRGVGIAQITHKKGKTIFSKYYYEPNYQGGGNGTENCEKPS